jgi:succinate dehydrogenase / fumarate reductase, membrane anchor subunit
MAPVVSRYAKNPVGAHYGLGDWLLQRITAVVMAAYTLVAVFCALLYPVRTYGDWRAMFSITSFRLFTMLFVAALLYHAWVGMRDILMDYVRATGLRLAAQVAVGVMLLFYLVWAASILWGPR